MVRLKLLGASRTPEISASDPLSGKGHYFLGADPGRWRKDVAQYGRVRYRQVYPGVDLVYHGRQGRLEYDFVLSPGSDPRAIRIGLDGAQATQLDGGGNLVVETAAGRLVQQAPLVYQEIDGQRREVTGAYVLHGEKEVGFAVGHCDADHPLVIDPVLEYSTYLGAAPATEAPPSRWTASAAPT